MRHDLVSLDSHDHFCPTLSEARCFKYLPKSISKLLSGSQHLMVIYFASDKGRTKVVMRVQVHPFQENECLIVDYYILHGSLQDNAFQTADDVEILDQNMQKATH